MASPLFLLVPALVVAGTLVILAFIVRPRPVRIPLRGRHVFISGGSSGIGLAVAHAAAAEGARISLLARDPRRLAAARDAIRSATGVDAAVYAVDVRDAAAVGDALGSAGAVDVLVCSHGVFYPEELEKQEPEVINFMIDVNLMGTFHVIKAALPAMKQRATATGQPASIAIMSSQGGQVGVYGYAGYSASKFGLRGLAEALQQEVILDNIHVSIICPRDTATPGFAEELRRRPEMTNVIAGTEAPMKPDDVAKICLDGIKRGAFFIACEGLALSVATAGLAPQRSWSMATVEVLGAGLMRLVALYVQYDWFSTIESFKAHRQPPAVTDSKLKM